jgi:hypothetical protein
MTRARLIGTLAVAVTALGAGSAQADRPATTDERAAILSEFEPRVEYCFEVRVSTADATWAAVYTASPRLAGCDAIGDGLILSHRDPTGAWSVAYEGSAEYPTCPKLGLPTAVGVDLKVCTAPVPAANATMTCLSNAGQRRVVRRPRTCTVRGPASRRIKLRGLRWANWGKSRATAAGRDDTGRRVTVRLSGRTEWPNQLFYSRLRVTGGSWGRVSVRVAGPDGSYDY